MSHTNPLSGTYNGLLILFNNSNEYKSGESPPCIHNILSSIKAIKGKQSNNYENYFQSL